MAVPPSERDQISAPHFEIPDHLTRRAIRQQQKKNKSFLHQLWNERGDIIEVRTQEIIASLTDFVESVSMNERGAEGSDLTVKFVKAFPIKEAKIEVKSSSLTLRHYKQKIRNKIIAEGKLTLAEWNKLNLSGKELIISSYLTRNNIILINGGEEDLKEKAPDEIIRDSFYPQLKRLIDVKNGMTPEEAVIAQQKGEIQIWPWVRPATFTQLFP